MSIAEKLTTIAENQQRALAAFGEINEALTTKGVETANTLEQVPQRIGEIVVRDDMARYAGGIKFGDLNIFTNKKIEFVFDNLRETYQLFTPYSGCTNKTVEHIIVSGKCVVTNAAHMFNMGWQDNALKHITVNIDLSKSIYGGSFLANANVVEIIDGNPLDFSSVTTAVQIWCVALKEVRFVPNTIKVNMNVNTCEALSAESIQSIIDALVDLTGQTAQKLEWHTDVLLKLTDEQFATITAKNWTM